MLFRSAFEEGHIDKLITVHEFPYELIPIESDVLSLDDNNGFGNLILNRDLTSLQLVKHSINRLEAMFGTIPVRYAKGNWSCSVYDSLISSKTGKTDSPSSEIDALIMIDRTIDFYTPLLTQMTYQGIIDEFYPINCGTITVDKKIVEPESTDEGKKELYLTGYEDILFEETRDTHFNVMKVFFRKKFDELKDIINSKDAFKTLKEMTEYMKRLRALNIPVLQKLYNQSKFMLL